MAIVSLSVRFRSMTVDEFIEHEALNIGAHGIYVPTAQPAPLDTLVQLQVRLASGQQIVAGLGRVVWARDVTQASAGRAPGMGVKFVKLDERSRAFVSNLVTATQEAGRAYEEEAEQTVTVDEPPLAAQRIAGRKTTPPSRPPVGRATSSIPAAAPPPTRPTGRPVPRDPRY